MQAADEFWSDAPVQSLELPAGRIAWRRFGPPSGAAPALLLVHGFPLAGYTWRKLLPDLARNHSCFVPDLPGMGATDWNANADFSWAGQARTLKAFADAQNLARYRVLAQDTGGSFARCLALIDAARVEKLAIVNSEMPGHRPPWIPLYQFLVRLPGSATAFRLLMRSRAFLRSSLGFGGCFDDLRLIDGEFHAAFIAPLLREPRRMEGLRRYLIGLADWSPVDAFAQTHAQMAMPVRLIWGTDDPTFPLPLARAMTRQFPRADLVEIPGARLLAHEEQPAAVARAALEFLGS